MITPFSSNVFFFDSLVKSLQMEDTALFNEYIELMLLFSSNFPQSFHLRLLFLLLSSPHTSPLEQTRVKQDIMSTFVHLTTSYRVDESSFELASLEECLLKDMSHSFLSSSYVRVLRCLLASTHFSFSSHRPSMEAHAALARVMLVTGVSQPIATTLLDMIERLSSKAHRDSVAARYESQEKSPLLVLWEALRKEVERVMADLGDEGVKKEVEQWLHCVKQAVEKRL
ncbi:hypothetical protein ADUPG1_008621 [Aduncisulcus paluster]|uniref:Uncharacterized protein n=2 Tax=Aduncisulcus paluster TaxID=2918883 RepID=A0ABQ5KSK9_9EUKA|nr:hypothetical protein ADUPG1_008621 [Aduncisulcus paluster]